MRIIGARVRADEFVLEVIAEDDGVYFGKRFGEHLESPQGMFATNSRDKARLLWGREPTVNFSEVWKYRVLTRALIAEKVYLTMADVPSYLREDDLYTLRHPNELTPCLEFSEWAQRWIDFVEAATLRGDKEEDLAYGCRFLPQS